MGVWIEVNPNNYVLRYDLIYQKSGFKRVEPNMVFNDPHKLNHQIHVEKAGFAFVYVSNETTDPNRIVHFDELLVLHTESPIVQSEDYYPFGLTFNPYQRVGNQKNRFKFNGIEEVSELGLNLYSTAFRNYDAASGRFNRIDPLTDYIPGISPYHFGFNNPIRFADPLGLFGKNKNKNDENGVTAIQERLREQIDDTKSRLSFYRGGGNGFGLPSGAEAQSFIDRRAVDNFIANNATTFVSDGYFLETKGLGDGRGNIIPGTEQYLFYKNFVEVGSETTPISNGQAAFQAFVQHFVPFGDEIFPREEDGIIRATVPDLPIGPGGAAKLTLRSAKLLVKQGGVWKWAVNGRVASKETLRRFGLAKPNLSTARGRPIIKKEFLETMSGVPNNPGPKSFWQKVKELIAVGGQLFQ